MVSKWVPTNQAAPVTRIGEENHNAATSASTGGTSPVISVQRARKIEVQLRRPSELQVQVPGVRRLGAVTALKKEAQEEP
ncbi:hypothetical protein U1Q18_017784 [Sarracenia purpurea var. burkii]